MLTILWDSQEPILETYQERGTTVTSATYCDMLQRIETRKSALKEEENCQRKFCCCTTMPALTLQPAHWKPSNN